MRRPSVSLALPLVAGLLVVAAGPALAVDPSPSPGPPGDPNTVVWQDVALPPDVPDGRTIDVGFTIWDLSRQTLSEVSSAKVRVHPKTGKAKPTEATTHSDWPGHAIAPITIPTGGLGTIEIGFPAQECHDDGTCVDLFVPFAFGGVGPPPDAPRSSLVLATIHPIVQPIVAGEPFDIDVDIAPKADWDPAALALPKDVIALASRVNGDEIARVDLRVVDDGHYTGTMTVGEGGQVNLLVGFGGEPNPDMIDRSIVRLRVQGGAAEATPAPSRGGAAPAPVAPAGDGLPIVPIALGAAALLAVALVLRRGLADL